MKRLIQGLGVVAILTAPAALSAQRVTFNGAQWPAADQTDATHLPGDTYPVPVADVIKAPPPKPGGSGTPPVPVDTPRIPVDLALEAVQTAIATCKAKGYLVAAVVTDAEGVIQVAVSAEGASPPGRIFTAAQKTTLAIAFRQPTSVTRDAIRANPARASEIKPNMMLYAGAWPIIVGGKLMGAIGSSGAPSVQDEACAKAGLDKILPKLK